MWVNDFVAAIESSTVASSKIEDAIAVKQEHLPKRIYKYRCDNEDSRKNLMDDTVWICSPAAYNDPYDCLFTLTEQDVLVAAKLSFVDDFVRVYGLDGVISANAILLAKASNDPLQQLVKHIPSDHPCSKDANPQQIADFFGAQLSRYVGDSIAFVRQIREATKICSFSQRNDSILMWGHYSDKHKGFCIEYELEPLPPNHFMRRNLYPVIYSSKLYDLTRWASQLFSSPRDQFNPCAVLLATLSKYRDWRYEKEWRFVLTESRLTANRAMSVPKPARVFLGSRIEDPSRRELTELCNRRGLGVWQMEMAADGFRLKATQVA